VTGVAELPEGVEMVMPAKRVAAVELITPVALEKGLRLRSAKAADGGAGTVAEIVK